ncbi:hypothetical protein DAPPUDRAFT_246133 [Daphnia pulex]|uniref:Uncharacterized protein n=1 Tax=Daphnia pulex TaxID=6669 RepID=E9GPP6_DAPPU|nr:hypothetical protein DAPPUDRAFT_246133 [Daphnia pulex]|eukprot:EFX78553.1 hypothetical protein DAPPUDRAFT_246133 [Daphnia pulex]
MYRAPSLDFDILLKCQAKLGSSIGKGVKDIEKVYQSMLPVFPVLAFLESLELKGNPGKALKHAFALAGRAFYDVSDFHRKNVLSIVGENFMQLIENRNVFDVLEHKHLFGATIIDKLLKFERLLEALVSLDIRARKRSGESGGDPRHAAQLHQHQQQPRSGAWGSGYQGRPYTDNLGAGGGASRFVNGAGPSHQQVNVGAGPSHRQFDSGGGWNNANHGFSLWSFGCRQRKRFDGQECGWIFAQLVKFVCWKPHPRAWALSWDGDVVSSYLRSQENTSLSLRALAAKLAILRALATPFVTLDLAATNEKSIKYSTNRFSFSWTRPRKPRNLERLTR